MVRWLRIALLGPAVAAVVQAAAGGASDAATPVTITVLGEPKYKDRHFPVELPDVPEDRQLVYQTWCTGEVGLRVAGLADEPYRVHLAYTEMAMGDPWRRVFDILLNGQLKEKEVCTIGRVGNYRVLDFDFTVTPQAGAITYAQRRSVPDADDPAFCLLQIFDRTGRLVAEQSAYAMRPANWELRGYLDLTREHKGPDPLAGRTAPPWLGTYKIHANETAKLTPADVLAPDGIAYPNWTRVGIPGGIPVRAVTLSAADFGATPNDESDDSAALQRAIAALEARSDGGVLFIPPGRYYLDRPIVIKGDNIVLRGAGPKETRLISRFSKRGEPPELHGLGADGQIHPLGYYYVWLDPEGLTGVDITADGRPVQRIKRSGLWENQIFFRFSVQELAGVVAGGETELKVSATYRDGTVRTTAHRVKLDAAGTTAGRGYGSLAMIAFTGVGLTGERVPLIADGRRGAMSLELAAGHGLKPGDRIQVNAPATARWDRLTASARPGAQVRTNHYEVTRVEGNRVWLAEALRLEFPVIDGASIQRLHPQVHCGIEDLGFEQSVRALIHGVMFEYGWECWVREVELVRAGDKALYMPHSKRCEVRDSTFDSAWYNVGGSAYIGWEHSFDCLMDHVTTYAMRHAPVLQWASSGNVIRRSVFHGSDAQWHAGWTNENLYEDLVVESSLRDGAYGNGMWASAPDDPGHGPNGPRNVIYNCDISSPKAGLWMGGMNEAWLILHNRFVVGSGPAVIAKTASFDHIIQDNVLVLLDPQPAAVFLGAADCTGIELSGNRCFGPVEHFVGGAAAPAVDRDNRVRKSGDIARPHPTIRSIFEWQQEHRAEIQAEQRRLAETQGSRAAAPAR